MKPRQNNFSETVPAPTTSAVPANPHELSLHLDGASSKTIPVPAANAIRSAVKDRKNSMQGYHCTERCITLELPDARRLLRGPERYQRKSARLYCSIPTLGGIA